MEIIGIIILFVVSLIVLVKGADLLLSSAEKIGLAAGLSPFIVGAVIIGLGTSLPEIISSAMAVIQGQTEIATANAVGSNIANIFLVIGLSVVVGGKLVVSKNLIDLDLPLLAITTAFFLGVAWDKIITPVEAFLLILVFGIYFLYTILHKDDKPGSGEQGLFRKFKKSKNLPEKPLKIKINKRPKATTKDLVSLVLGLLGLIFGAKFLVDAVIDFSETLNIGVGIISLFAVALGTSLPELIVSIKATLNNKPEIALGNVFGSNIFNLLLVVGLPGLFKTLSIDEQTFSLGLPTLAIATFLFVISGISRRIHVSEGAIYVIMYVFFIGKLFSLF